MNAPIAPPPAAFFAAPRPPAGSRTAGLRLGPLEIAFEGLSDALADTLRERYTIFAIDGAEAPDALRVALQAEPREYFIQPEPTPQPAQVLLAYDDGERRVRYLSYRLAGWFDTLGGRGVALLARGEWEPAVRALENYVRSAVAWQAASRGGALIHAASAVLDGRGYLFYGESGAGKSTLSACNRRAQMISDDLSLVLPGPDGRPHLVGSPFRGTYEEGAPVQCSVPLAAGFRIVKDTAAAVRPVPRLRALGELVGNLPFVAEAFGRRPDLFDAVEAALRPIPLAHLHFRKDDSYWDAIRAAGY